jgi:hypothetical protein
MRTDRRSQKTILRHLKVSRWKRMVRTLEPDEFAKWIESWIKLDHCITTNDQKGVRKAANEIAKIVIRDA